MALARPQAARFPSAPRGPPPLHNAARSSHRSPAQVQGLQLALVGSTAEDLTPAQQRQGHGRGGAAHTSTGHSGRAPETNTQSGTSAHVASRGDVRGARTVVREVGHNGEAEAPQHGDDERGQRHWCPPPQRHDIRQHQRLVPLVDPLEWRCIELEGAPERRGSSMHLLPRRNAEVSPRVGAAHQQLRPATPAALTLLLGRACTMAGARADARTNGTGRGEGGVSGRGRGIGADGSACCVGARQAIHRHRAGQPGAVQGAPPCGMGVAVGTPRGGRYHDRDAQLGVRDTDGASCGRPRPQPWDA